MKIIVPISSDGNITKQCKKSLGRLGGKYSIVYPNGYDLGTQMCSEIDLNEDEHFFLDSDIEFDPRDIETLRHCGCDVVSGAYKKSTKDMKIIGNKSWLEGGNNAFVAGMWSDTPGLIGYMVQDDCTALIPIDWHGTGFCYVKTWVFKKIIDLKQEPVFYHQTIRTDIAKFGVCQTSADLGFCLNLMKINVKPWINCGVQVRHIKR